MFGHKMRLIIFLLLATCHYLEAFKTNTWNGIRLVGGDDHYGRLEVKRAGIWGTVCGHDWTFTDAQVACQQLGFTDAVDNSTETQIFGTDNSTQIFYSHVNCSGDENEIQACDRNEDIGLTNCTQSDNVSIFCVKPEETAAPSICTHEQIQCTSQNMCIPRRWKCDGTEDCADRSDEQNCTLTTNFPLSAHPFRLTGGGGSYEGRLEFEYAGVWGTVCDDAFNMRAANVACRDIGYRGATQLKSFGRGNGQIWLDEVNCQGNESSILNCRRNSFAAHDCDHSEDVGIVCEDCGTQIFPIKSARIVGGQIANKGSWPWQATIRIQLPDGDSEHLCGGTLIEQQWVLTAAHCFDGSRDRGRYTVRLGEHDMKVDEHTEQDFNLAEIYIHNTYLQNMHPNDIALVKLDRPAVKNDYVHSACLPSMTGDGFGENDFCFATGWGDTKATGDSNVLRQVQLPLYNFGDCQSIYGDKRILPSMLCAGYVYGGRDTCQGDSGGPLVCKRSGQWEVAGIVSWGDGCAAAHHPGVYTRVDHYKQWITQTIEHRGKHQGLLMDILSG